MTIKRKDFQKAAAFVHEFLLKLTVDVESAELRDALNLALLHMQRHYRNLRAKQQNHGRGGGGFLTQSLRGLSPMTPFKDTPDKFQWRWTELEQKKVAETLPVEFSKEQSTVPVILRIAKEGEDNRLLQLLETEPGCINEVDARGRNALMYAVHFERLDTVQHLLERNIDINATTVDGATAVHRACYDGNHEALQLLIEYNADLSIVDRLQRAPVHWASANSNRKCLELLLEKDVDVNVRDLEGMTPSMWACRMDHIEHFSLLSELETQPGPDTDGFDRDSNGRTWLHWSVRRTEPLECLRTLMTEDAASLYDEEGKTVMHIAAEQGSLASVKAILEIAGKHCLEHRDNQNRTPLHLATMGGHGEVVNFLLSQEVDLALVDNWGRTAWDYARARQLHYCMLIIASYIRQRNKYTDTATSDDPSEQGDGVHVMGRRNAEENLGMGNLQINGDGSTETHVFQNAPMPLPVPPSCPPTPRTPRGPATPRPVASAPTLDQAPVPPAREHPSHQPHSSPHHYPSNKGTPPTPRGYAVKRSPSAPMEWVNGDGRLDGNDRDISSAGSGGKRKKNNDHEATDKTVSVSSIDSGDLSRVKEDGKGTEAADAWEAGMTLEADGAINDDDLESVSMDAMDVSDLDGDATPRSAAFVQQSKSPSPRHRQQAPSSGLSQYHMPTPPAVQPQVEPPVTQGSVPPPQEWDGEAEAEDGYNMKQDHVDGSRPQPTPRARQSPAPKADDRALPSGLLSPIPLVATPVKKKKKKKKKDKVDTTPHDLSPMVNTPRGYAAPVLPPQAPVPVPQRRDRTMSGPPSYQQQGQGHTVQGHVGHDQEMQYQNQTLANIGGHRPRKKNAPPEQQHEEKFMLDENARMLTQMLTSTGGAICQSPLAPPIPQALPRQKPPQQQQQQQQRKPPQGHMGHQSPTSDDRLSPRGEEGKYSQYGHAGLPPSGQMEQQRSGTRFGNRSPTASAGQNRQREMSRSPALVPPPKRRIGSAAQNTSATTRERHSLPQSESKPPTGKSVSWGKNKPANGRFPLY